MKKANLVLTGFMGTGKSFVSIELGKYYHRPVRSTDKEIETRAGQSIAEIFSGSGEKQFRELEREVVKSLAGLDGIIIDCGGGVLHDPENVSHLKRTGQLIGLCASPEVIYERLKACRHRPLLNVKDPLARIKELLAERESTYRLAEIMVVTDHKSVAQICKEIIGKVDHE